MKGKRILVVSQHYWPENFRITDICAGFAADGCEVVHAARQRAAEGAQHAAGQLEAGQAGKGLAVGCVHRGIPATGQDIGSRAGDLFTLHEQGERCVSGIQRAGDHLGAFGNKDAFFRFQTIAQLRLRQAGIDIQLRCGKVCDLDNIRHKEVLLWKSFFLILTQPVRECKVRAVFSALAERRNTHAGYVKLIWTKL